MRSESSWQLKTLHVSGSIHICWLHSPGVAVNHVIFHITTGHLTSLPIFQYLFYPCISAHVLSHSPGRKTTMVPFTVAPFYSHRSVLYYLMFIPQKNGLKGPESPNDAMSLFCHFVDERSQAAVGVMVLVARDNMFKSTNHIIIGNMLLPIYNNTLSIQ